MAYALELVFGLPPAWGYLVYALVVVPLVTHGVSVISKLQVWTQPLWLAMLVVPYVAVWVREPGAVTQVVHYGGELGQGGRFQCALFWCSLDGGHCPYHPNGGAGRLFALHARSRSRCHGRRPPKPLPLVGWWAGGVVAGAAQHQPEVDHAHPGLEGRSDPLYHSVRRPHLHQLKSEPFTQKFGHAHWPMMWQAALVWARPRCSKA